MLDSEKIDFLVDFLSGNGEIGKILLRQKKDALTMLPRPSSLLVPITLISVGDCRRTMILDMRLLTL